MKRKIAAAVAAIMLCAVFTCAVSAFSDVNYDTPEGAAIKRLADAGIIGGFENGSFKPDDTVTREQFAKMIYTAETGQQEAPAGTTGFNDVAADRWSAGYIKWAAEQGIVGGVGDGRFDPTGTLTIAQAAKMLLVANGASQSLAFPDGYMELAGTAGYLKDVKTTGANDAASRAAVALIISNSMDSGELPSPPAAGRDGKSSGIVLSVDGSSITLASCDENGRGKFPFSRADSISPTDPIKGIFLRYDIDQSSVFTGNISASCRIETVDGTFGSEGVAAQGALSDLKASEGNIYYSADYTVKNGEITEITFYKTGAEKEFYEVYESLCAIPLTIPVYINPGNESVVNIWYGPQCVPRDLDFTLTALTQPSKGEVKYATTHPTSFWLLRYTQAKDAKVGDTVSFTYTLTTRDGFLNRIGVVNIRLVPPTVVPDKTVVVEKGKNTNLEVSKLLEGVVYTEDAPNPNETVAVYATDSAGKPITTGSVTTEKGGVLVRKTMNILTYSAPDTVCEDVIKVAFFDGWDYSYFNITINVVD